MVTRIADALREKPLRIAYVLAALLVIGRPVLAGGFLPAPYDFSH
jgi:hypothetical protein